jgi:simple sugar transport system ATP-binding protein
MPGEIVGVSGLLGSGRTELALALFGMKPHYAGQIRIDGRDAKLDSVQRAIEHGIAYVPEDRLTEGLFLTQTIDRNMLATSHARLSKGGIVQGGRAAREAAGMIQEMAIATPTGNRPVTQLSGGNAQRVVIGRWLLNDLGVLMISDDLPELVDNCNRILVLHRGRLVSDTPTEATSEAALSEQLGALA